MKEVLDVMTRANHRIACIGLKPVAKGIALATGVHPVERPLSTVGAILPIDPYSIKYYRALRILESTK